MTPHQKIYADICAEMEAEAPITIRTKQAVETLAYIIVEEKHFQDIVNEEGIHYETTGDKGQRYIKTRPEYVELQRLRDKKRAYLSKLGFGIGEATDEDF
jgi:hypothetical protein